LPCSGLDIVMGHIAPGMPPRESAAPIRHAGQPSKLRPS
jgi:hypothetical protein